MISQAPPAPVVCGSGATDRAEHLQELSIASQQAPELREAVCWRETGNRGFGVAQHCVYLAGARRLAAGCNIVSAISDRRRRGVHRRSSKRNPRAALV
jgi:hypothetical protein